MWLSGRGHGPGLRYGFRSSFHLRPIRRETDRMIAGVEVDHEGPEIAPKGADERLHGVLGALGAGWVGRLARQAGPRGAAGRRGRALAGGDPVSQPSEAVGGRDRMQSVTAETA
jgi:hypothetical protein